MKRLVLAFAVLSQLSWAGWKPLFNGRDLSGWRIVGQGAWSAPGGGLLVGQGDLRTPFRRQSWLYTTEEFGDFDLQLDYLLRLGGNSGVSIWDSSHGRYAVDPDFDGRRTPSHIGYEINIDNDALTGFDVSGSIYLIEPARGGLQKNDAWNHIEIRGRSTRIEVLVNGVLAARHAPVPGRPLVGPIGLQLHDSKDIVLFKNIRIRPYKRKNARAHSE